MHYLDNSDYIRFNNLWIGPDGKSGIGTYSNKFDFVSGSVSSNVPFSTGGAYGFSASFVFLPRVISMSGNITYNTGTNSIVYISKTNTSNLILTIATPSVTYADGLQENPIQGFSIIFRKLTSTVFLFRVYSRSFFMRSHNMRSNSCCSGLFSHIFSFFLFIYKIKFEKICLRDHYFFLRYFVLI